MLQMTSVGFFFPKPRLCGTLFDRLSGYGKLDTWQGSSASWAAKFQVDFFSPPQQKPREVELILVGFSWGKKIYSFVEKNLVSIFTLPKLKDHFFSWESRKKKTKLQKCWKEIPAGRDRFVWRVWLFNALYGLRFQISTTNPR